MPDKDAETPRVFIARHGETEWTQNGRYTGKSEIPLTTTGDEQVLSTGGMLVGENKLIDPAKLAKVWVSPRRRAQRTYELLFDGSLDIVTPKANLSCEQLAEWDYGAYEGLLTHQIKDRRKAQGLDKEHSWDIWRDGCESGEMPKDVTKRLDELIQEIHTIQASNMHGEKACDVVLVAHGHILRAFVKRWLKYPLDMPLSLMLEPGGIGILSYQHQNIDEPALMVGMSFPPQKSK